MSVTEDFNLTAAERDLLPTAEEVAQYAERGWHLSRPLFSDEELDLLQEATEKYYEGHRDRTLPARPPHLASWEPSHGRVQRHNDYIHYESETVGRILRKPLLGAVAAALAQASQIRVFQATLIYKPPNAREATNLVPWHMDRHYWQTCTSQRMLTAFIPFHDCGVRMGTITMIDGSNRWREPAEADDSTRHFAERDRGELEQILAATARLNGQEIRRVPVEILRGQVSFHHCMTYHGSGANLSGLPRRAISLHLQDGENRHRPFPRPDGTPVVYNHDVLVRRTADGLPDYADPEFCPTLWKAPA
ncbi:MAG TPA: phytanoyl-CoA dioxygenase family protein [Actinocrinis sp.]|jgi:hypothetical protein